MSAKSRKSRPVHIREPHLLGFILVATLVIVAGVVSIGETGDAWLVALVVVVMFALAAALALDVGFAIDAREGASPAPAAADAPEIAPVDAALAPSSDFTGARTRRHVIVVTSQPVAATTLVELLGSLDGLEVMVVSPEGFGHREITNDESRYASARRAEEITVASLRRAGIPAAGHVGDHDPIQAIEDARMLCGAERAVVVTHRDIAAPTTPRSHRRSGPAGSPSRPRSSTSALPAPDGRPCTGHTSANLTLNSGRLIIALLAGHHVVRRTRSAGRRVDHVTLAPRALDPPGFAGQLTIPTADTQLYAVDSPRAAPCRAGTASSQ